MQTPPIFVRAKQVILLLFLMTSLGVCAQKKRDLSEIEMPLPLLGNEFRITQKNGEPLRNGRYKVIDGQGVIRFKIRRGNLASDVAHFAQDGNLVLEIVLEDHRVVELRKYINYAIKPLNKGKPKLMETRSIADGVYCETFFDEHARKTHKRCTEGIPESDDYDFERVKTLYLYECATFSKDPENTYCEEKDYAKETTQYYKNGLRYKTLEIKKSPNQGHFFITTHYDSSEKIQKTVYEYRDSIKTIRADKSYSVELLTDSRTSSVKVSHYTEYDSKGNALATERREKQRFFDGTTQVKRIQKNQVILETYADSGELLERKILPK